MDDFDDDFDSDPINMDAKPKPAATKIPEIKPATAKDANPFDKKVKPAFDDLEDIGFELDSDRPIEFGNKKKDADLVTKAPAASTKKEDDNGLIANDFGDDFDDYYGQDFEEEEEQEPKSEQKKPAVGKQDEDIFNKSSSEAKKASSEQEDDDQDPEKQAKMIEEQFNYIYENDPQLRQVLGSEAQGLSLEEKYQIMNAYMKGGGVQGLLGDEDNEGLDEEEAKMVEEQFKEIFDTDPKLREVLQGQTPETLTIREKHELLMAYKKGGGVEGILNGEGEEEDDEKSVIMHNGLKLRKV